MIRTAAAAVLLSAAALTLVGCSTSLQGPANPNDTQTTSYGPPITTNTQPSLTVSQTSGNPSSGNSGSGSSDTSGNPTSPSDTGTTTTPDTSTANA
jgi:type IV pilus biogenesis protein CpaD/CtpE